MLVSPVMIYAHEVVMDSQGRLKPGDWVRTTPMVSFSDGFCFQTRNTAYFLLGPRTRKSAELATVVKVFSDRALPGLPTSLAESDMTTSTGFGELRLAAAERHFSGMAK